MATVSDELTSICNHCVRAVPYSNIDLHYAHCLRNLEKCKICGDMVPKKQAEEHHLRTHAQIACSLCSEVMERQILDVHIGENCPQRIVTCEYCEFPLPAANLFEHQEVCGNRTEYCNLCRKYIRLCNRFVHAAACTGIHDDIAEPPRNERPLEREVYQQPPRGRPQGLGEKRSLLFTAVIAGAALVVGSLFFHEKNRH